MTDTNFTVYGSREGHENVNPCMVLNRTSSTYELWKDGAVIESRDVHAEDLQDWWQRVQAVYFAGPERLRA